MLSGDREQPPCEYCKKHASAGWSHPCRGCGEEHYVCNPCMKRAGAEADPVAVMTTTRPDYWREYWRVTICAKSVEVFEALEEVAK